MWVPYFDGGCFEDLEVILEQDVFFPSLLGNFNFIVVILSNVRSNGVHGPDWCLGTPFFCAVMTTVPNISIGAPVVVMVLLLV